MDDKETKRAITYGVLAHIRNSGGQLARGPIDVFVPLVKRILHFLNSEQTQYKGESINEIRLLIEERYGIDFPLPVLKNVLQKLVKEINSDSEVVFELFQDGAFWIKNYVFEDYEEQLNESKRKVQALQMVFKEFCKINDVSDIDESCVIKFIEKNKYVISRYLAHTTIPEEENLTIPALFIEYFRCIPTFYSQIRDIYLGSTLTCVLEYDFSIKMEVTLLLDTNFIVSLIDLNTPESTHTCTKLLDVCGKIGYRFVILPETLEEIKSLIKAKSRQRDQAVLLKYIRKEDILNACERRNLFQADLDRICDDLEEILENYNIYPIANTTSLRNRAIHSREYKSLKEYRNTDSAALHDAMAILYVKEKRGGKDIKEFEKVNCWFVNNSITNNGDNGGIDTLINSAKNPYQPEIIKADNLLSILWLSNPNINTSLANNEVADIGLTSLVASTLNKSLPKARIIKELDENIQKYRSQDITERHIYLLSSRIASAQIKDIERFGELAETNPDEFNRRIKEEAKKQEIIEAGRAKKIEKLLKKLEIVTGNMEQRSHDLELKIKEQKEVSQIMTQKENEIKEKIVELQNKDAEIERLRKANIEQENRNRRERLERYKDDKLRKGRARLWIYVISVSLLLCAWIGYRIWTVGLTEMLSQDILITGVCLLIVGAIITQLREKYDPLKIDSFKENIKIPEDLTPVE
jgi:predicted nucleic acid-binding protein